MTTSYVRIADREVGVGRPVLLIAEAGVNHNGDLGLALRLVDAAAEAGADIVKFQTFCADATASLYAPKSRYQIETSHAAESQVEMLRRLELDEKAHRLLIERCRERGIIFLSSPFDVGSLRLLVALGVPAIKIGSGEITNRFLLETAAGTGLPVILSTGMSDLREVREAVTVLEAGGGDRLVLLHCISEYPADPRDVNLRAMHALSGEFACPVGFSDHTAGGAVALAAAALGASVIEKHLTLDRNLQGPDHRASLEPSEFAALACDIRRVEAALGTGEKVCTSTEQHNRDIVRRSLVAARRIHTGDTIDRSCLTALRPANGISPMRVDAVVGRKATRDLDVGSPLAWDDLE